MIRAQGLSKFYAGHRAIEDVSFTINEGEIVGLLGLNGAGKSTILKILGCFLLPSAGSASINGISVEDEPHQIRKMIGYLPDTPPLYNEMVVERYLGYVARLKDVPVSDVESHVADALKLASLDDVASTPVGSLSHGYRQRVGIAQALVHKPRVLILDEPINGLDPVQIVEMRDMILSLKQRHTVILSSHILSEITKTCDRILIVDKGKLVAEGDESMLGTGQVQSIGLTVTCEVRDAVADLEARLTSLTMVTQVSSRPGLAGIKQYDIEMSADGRAEIAKVIVESGSGLVGMSNSGRDLENLFMKFVRS